MSEFGKFLKESREAKGLSLTDLGEQVGINHSHLSRIENGVRPAPKTPTLVKLANALNIPLPLLLEKANVNIDNEQAEQLGQIHSDSNGVVERILDLLKKFVNDEGFFLSKYHAEVFNIFGGKIVSEDGQLGFNKWYGTFLQTGEDDRSKADEEYAYSEFNKFYNYRTIKNDITNYNSTDSNEKFLHELQTLIKNSDPYQNEKELVSNIELSDEELLNRFSFSFEGKPLSEKEIKRLLAYIRVEHSLD
ncbi:helix-turn-helix domain-containing protein [Paenibacillus sp. 481]|uniref:helix-turn-helix domain-containing protein n=1 Tax=Paenibacillus sp. 481 TaxID=2835869 RepID=UPI001E5E848C|nr:helix-turn-helix transcriptional regulator [Paenibacillus sp. 481]UHA74439.1 helix-turn-helix domain-containing protein [Paenibacillus sp. 481]